MYITVHSDAWTVAWVWEKCQSETVNGVCRATLSVERVGGKLSIVTVDWVWVVGMLWVWFILFAVASKLKG